MLPSAQTIRVNVVPFEELFDAKDKIIIPEYQRPYEWGKEKTAELLEDFKNFFIEKKSSLNYYLGTVLFYYESKTGCFEIIDGQQRITTLLILKRVLSRTIKDSQDIEFNSHLSLSAIGETTSFARTELDLLTRLEEYDFFNRLEFTQVITYSQDDCFSFFDTQNNRGVVLSATDFLKAYNLREIESDHLQQICATDWENDEMRWPNNDFLIFLFNKILYRARAWKSKSVSFETKELILEIFQKQTIPPLDKSTYAIYPNYHNRYALARTFADDGSFSSNVRDKEEISPELYPFSLRQPIFKGLHFFHFSQKYSGLYKLLFESPGACASLKELSIFYTQIYNQDMSLYLRHLFKLAVIMYYDVFRDEEILSFVYHLDYLIGSARIEKTNIKKESAAIILTGAEYNLLDVIAHAYLPGDVTSFIKGIFGKDTVYKESDKKITGDGVQSRYRARVLAYFKKPPTEFINRKQWLND